MPGEPTGPEGVPCPEMGPGWRRVSKKRASDPTGRHTDHTFVAPDGQRFNSRVKAVRYAAADGFEDSGDDEAEAVADTWAQCERCDKWRKLSGSAALPKHWFCELNPNRAFASCQVAEEQWTDDGEDCFAQVCKYCKSEGKVHRRCLRLPNCHVQRDSKKKHYASRTAAAAQSRSVELRAMAQAASPASERDSPQSRALVVRCGHRAGEQPSAEALETLREWVLAHGCGSLEAGWRATTQTRRDHDGPSSGHVDRYYYSPSGE